MITDPKTQAAFAKFLNAETLLLDEQTAIQGVFGVADAIKLSTTRPSVGAILNKSNWTNLSGFTPNGATPSVSGGNLVFSGGSGATTNTLDYDYGSCLQQWEQSIDIIVGTVSSGSYGLGLGLRGYHPLTAQQYSVMAQLSLTNVVGQVGKLYIYYRAANVATSSTGITFTAGDTVRLTVGRNALNVYARARNITTNGAEVSVSYDYVLTSPTSVYLPNDCRPCVVNLGGTQTLTRWTMDTLEPTNPTLVLVGDSKTQGYYAGSMAALWSERLKSVFRTVVLAGGSSRASTTLQRMTEILSVRPKHLVLNIGRNDLGDGVALATVTADYDRIVSRLTAAGITVWHLLPLAESSLNQSGLTSHITTNYAANRLIDAGLSGYGGTGTTLDADGVHPNALGNEIIYRVVVQTLANGGVALR